MRALHLHETAQPPAGRFLHRSGECSANRLSAVCRAMRALKLHGPVFPPAGRFLHKRGKGSSICLSAVCSAVRALKMHGGGPPVVAGKPLDEAYRTENIALVGGSS